MERDRQNGSCHATCLTLGILLACLTTPAWAGSFTYQGQLKDAGLPMNGTVDFLFTLFDSPGVGDPPTGGAQIGSEQSINGVEVVNGLFTVTVKAHDEFGLGAFDGGARWLQIEVDGTTLSPRQPLTATPHALMLSPGAVIKGAPSQGILGSVLTVDAVDGAAISGGGLAAFGNQSASTSATWGVVSLSRAGIAALSFYDSTKDIGVYGSAANNGFAGYFDDGKSYFGGSIGVGTTTPGFPLSFADTGGDKISLYGQSSNHYGFGIQPGLLQMHSDGVLTDIAFGAGSSSSFIELAHQGQRQRWNRHRRAGESVGRRGRRGHRLQLFGSQCGPYRRPDRPGPDRHWHRDAAHPLCASGQGNWIQLGGWNPRRRRGRVGCARRSERGRDARRPRCDANSLAESLLESSFGKRRYRHDRSDHQTRLALEHS